MHSHSPMSISLTISLHHFPSSPFSLPPSPFVNPSLFVPPSLPPSVLPNFSLIPVPFPPPPFHSSSLSPHGTLPPSLPHSPLSTQLHMAKHTHQLLPQFQLHYLHLHLWPLPLCAKTQRQATARQSRLPQSSCLQLFGH